MKRFILGVAFLLLAWGWVLAQEEKPAKEGKKSKHHTHQKRGKTGKSAKSKNEGGIKLESQIRDGDVKFQFQEGKKPSQTRKGSRKKKQEEANSENP